MKKKLPRINKHQVKPLPKLSFFDLPILFKHLEAYYTWRTWDTQREYNNHGGSNSLYYALGELNTPAARAWYDQLGGYFVTQKFTRKIARKMIHPRFVTDLLERVEYLHLKHSNNHVRGKHQKL